MAQEDSFSVDPDTHNYYFDRAGAIKANGTISNHNYKPVHPPIKVPFTQDLTEELKAHKKGAFLEDVDPYLCIAELRTLFEGKGRKLAGFQILANGVKSPPNGKKYTVENHPPFKKLSCKQLLRGVGWNMLDEYGVDRLVCLHLSYYMAFCERMRSYHDVCTNWQEEITNSHDSKRVTSLMRSLKEFRKAPSIADNQWDTTWGNKWKALFPNISLQREALMLPGKVKFPAEISWSTLELALKEILEKGVEKDGFIGYGQLEIIACDQAGAIAFGHGSDSSDNVAGAEWGNSAYHMTLQDDIQILMKQDFAHHKNPTREIADYMWHAYDGFVLDYYLGRKRVPKDSPFRIGFSKEIDAAMLTTRRAVQARLKKEGKPPIL